MEGCFWTKEGTLAQVGELISIPSLPAFLPSVSEYRVLTPSPIFAEGGHDFNWTVFNSRGQRLWQLFLKIDWSLRSERGEWGSLEKKIISLSKKTFEVLLGSCLNLVIMSDSLFKQTKQWKKGAQRRGTRWRRFSWTWLGFRFSCSHAAGLDSVFSGYILVCHKVSVDVSMLVVTSS